MTTPHLAFCGLASASEDLFEGLVPNGPERRVTVQANYPTDDHFIIDTPAGAVDIPAILFSGELRLKESKVPIVYSGEYRNRTSGERISQHVSFAPQTMMGMKFAVEMHKLAQTGETRVVLRRLADDC